MTYWISVWSMGEERFMRSIHSRHPLSIDPGEHGEGSLTIGYSRSWTIQGISSDTRIASKQTPSNALARRSCQIRERQCQGWRASLRIGVLRSANVKANATVTATATHCQPIHWDLVVGWSVPEAHIDSRSQQI